MATNSFGNIAGTAGAMTSTSVSATASAAAAAAAGVNADLWRECVAWLVRCKVIPVDHKAALPDAEIRILAMTLRDGVLLCNLIIHLDASSMDAREFNRKPQMAQFLCCKNIKLFLDLCRNHFNIRDVDLFEPTMLYDLTNFHRVLITLSKLSQCRKVQQMHPELLGFNLQVSPSERSHSDEAIYKDLHSTNQLKTTGSLDATGSSSSDYYEHNSHTSHTSLSVEDENSDITIENGTADIDDYIEDSLSNICDSTTDPDAINVDIVHRSVQGQLRALSFDMSLSVISSSNTTDCITPTPQLDSPKPSTSAAAPAAAAGMSASPEVSSFSKERNNKDATPRGDKIIQDEQMKDNNATPGGDPTIQDDQMKDNNDDPLNQLVGCSSSIWLPSGSIFKPGKTLTIDNAKGHWGKPYCIDREKGHYGRTFYIDQPIATDEVPKQT